MPTDQAPMIARHPEVVVPIRPVASAPQQSRDVGEATPASTKTEGPDERADFGSARSESGFAPQAYAAPASENRLLPQLQEEVQQVLLSEAVGEQIARSFDELAAAIDGGERRSLDEIAQDMLRPMLHDWLDDNLPTLVERLVREEIERVARGPRR
jgi:cell pole-organizing protein PopZ